MGNVTMPAPVPAKEKAVRLHTELVALQHCVQRGTGDVECREVMWPGSMELWKIPGLKKRSYPTSLGINSTPYKLHLLTLVLSDLPIQAKGHVVDQQGASLDSVLRITMYPKDWTNAGDLRRAVINKLSSQS